MNALLIHYYYPPIRSGAVLRNYYFSREFSQYFDQVYVLTTDNRQMLAQEPLPLPDNVTVLEAKTFDYRRWIGNQTSSHLPEEKKQKPLLTWLGKLMKTLPFHFIMGEGGLLYIFSAVRIGKKLIKAKKIDFIYSSFGPYADHFIAYTIKGKNKQLPWVADFRDLQVEPLYRNVFLRKWQVAIERFLLRRANLVTTISDGLKKHLEIYGRPVMSVPRGVKMHAGKKETFDKFTICYTGSLYQDYRDANLFFSELARLLDQGHIEKSSIQFIYAGRDGGQFSHWIKQYGLEDCFVNRGFLTREETLNLQRRSHLQLLLTSATDQWTGVFTGKVFEYLESGNPVLVLIKGAKDLEFEQLMKSTGAGKVFYDPPEETGVLSNFLIDLYRSWKDTGTLDWTVDRIFIEHNLSWNGQTRKILEGVNIL